MRWGQETHIKVQGVKMKDSDTAVEACQPHIRTEGVRSRAIRYSSRHASPAAHRNMGPRARGTSALQQHGATL